MHALYDPSRSFRVGRGPSRLLIFERHIFAIPDCGFALPIDLIHELHEPRLAPHYRHPSSHRQVSISPDSVMPELEMFVIVAGLRFEVRR